MRRGLLSLLFFCACPGGETPMDAGVDAGTTLVVTSISPDRGPTSGGTTVTINGAGFESGASVTFGTTAAASVTFESSRKLTAVTPAVPEGRASVTVANGSGRSASLPAAFLFEGGMTGTIADAVALNVALSTDTSGTDPVPVVVKGQVKVLNVTDQAGAPAGVRAQVGFAPQGASPTIAWVDASWLEDADLYDTFSGTVMLPGAMGMGVSSYVLSGAVLGERRRVVGRGRSRRLDERSAGGAAPGGDGEQARGRLVQAGRRDDRPARQPRPARG
ncbi:MAG: IPT/TIG domain-containing protein [Archangiaceae bacterium]|nr:IPT/TIG domain-containing protein [Archangiaceae bacterium]